jgi:hypothetical protein
MAQPAPCRFCSPPVLSLGGSTSAAASVVETRLAGSAGRHRRRPRAARAIPVLPPETYIRYARALHLTPPAIETHRLGPLPQIFADQFGWEDMVATVARVYNSLPPEVRPKTAISARTTGKPAR